MANKLLPSRNNSALCMQRDPGNKGYGDIMKQGAFKGKGEMNKNIRASFDVQKWYKNKVLADIWWCRLISDIYSCLHQISTQCWYMYAYNLCGNYIFHLAQWNWLSFDHGSCPASPFQFCFSEKYMKFPHVFKLYRSRYFGEIKEPKPFLDGYFGAIKLKNSFTFQKRSEKSQSLPEKKNAGNQYAWNRKVLNMMAKIAFAQWKLRTLHSII